MKTTDYRAKSFAHELARRCSADSVERHASARAVEESRVGGLGEGVCPVYHAA